MKVIFILNPRAGRNRRRPQLGDCIKDFIKQHRLDATVVLTRGPGHATELARSSVAAGINRVVAVGGDGTMNEVAQGLVGTSTVLALVPCGSGNGLALHLGLPTQFSRALDLLVDRSAAELPIDTGSANGHPFFNAMGVGFDAEISQRFNRLARRGLAAYVRTAITALRAYHPQRYVIESGGQHFELSASLVAVSNSDQYGNNAFIAPRASVVDGKLDLVALPPVHVFGAARLATRLFLGSLDRHPKVFRQVGTHFAIHREAPSILHTDGETHETGATIRVEIRPASLRLLVQGRLP